MYHLSALRSVLASSCLCSDRSGSSDEKAVRLLRSPWLVRAAEFSQRTGILKEFFIHMKRSLALAVTLASGFVLSAAAQTPAAPTAPSGPTKIAIVAFQAAVAQTNEGQRNFADLQKKYDPKRQQLKGLSDEIDSLKKQLQAQGDKLSDAERATRAKTVDDKEKQLQRSAEDAQRHEPGDAGAL